MAKISEGKLTDFVPDPGNANLGTERGQAMIEDSIREDGAARSIVVDADNVIVAGSKTHQGALDAGLQKAVVVEVRGDELVVVKRTDFDLDGDGGRARRYAYRDNRSGELNLAWSASQISVDLAAGVDLSGMFADVELEAILGEALMETREAPEPQTNKGAELAEHYGVKVSQVWQLGEHRLAVGDCTNQVLVDTLMQDERAQALITDPPFNVREDEWDVFESDTEFREFTAKWLKIGKQKCDVICCFMADKTVPLLRAAAAHAEIPYRRALIWRKPPGSQFAGASLDGFWFDFEIIQVFGKPQFQSRKDTQMAVLEHRTVVGQEHGCEKPISLLEDLINGYSQREKLVIDFFAGTGTTMIGCERQNRCCYSIELRPTIAAVAIQRWVDLTGGEPRLLT